MSLPTVLLAITAISLLFNGVLWLIVTAKARKIHLLKQQNQTQKKELANVRQRQQITHDAYRLDADELDKRLQQDFRD